MHNSTSTSSLVACDNQLISCGPWMMGKAWHGVSQLIMGLARAQEYDRGCASSENLDIRIVIDSLERRHFMPHESSKTPTTALASSCIKD